jgi:hypothetical protein
MSRESRGAEAPLLHLIKGGQGFESPQLHSCILTPSCTVSTAQRGFPRSDSDHQLIVLSGVVDSFWRKSGARRLGARNGVTVCSRILSPLDAVRAGSAPFRGGRVDTPRWGSPWRGGRRAHGGRLGWRSARIGRAGSSSGGDESLVPAQDRRGGDEEAESPAVREQTGQGGDQGSIGPADPGSRTGPLEHGELVAKDEDLDVLGGVGSAA